MRTKRLVGWCAAVATTTALAHGGVTLIGPLPYLSEADSPFDIGAPGFVLIDFEDDMFDVPGVGSNLTENNVIGPGGLTDSVDGDDGVIDGNGTNGHSFFNGSGSVGVTITFDAAVLGGYPTQAGIVWTDGAGTTSFEAFGPDGASLGVIGPVAIATAGFTGQTDEDRFFGVESEAGISSIKVSNTSGGIEVDHVQFLGGQCPPAEADLDGSGTVDGADLGLLLAAWGSCTGCCEADLNGDRSVDGADLGLLLGAWTG